MNFKYDVRSDEEILRMSWIERIDYFFDLLNNWKEFVPNSDEMRTKKGRMVTVLKKRYDETVISYQKRMEYESKIHEQEVRKLFIEDKLSKCMSQLQENIVRCLDVLKGMSFSQLKEEKEVFNVDFENTENAHVEIELLNEHKKEENVCDSMDRLVYLGQNFHKITKGCRIVDYVLPAFLNKSLPVLIDQFGKNVRLYRNAKKIARVAKQILLSRVIYILYLPGFDECYINLLDVMNNDVTLRYLKIQNYVKDETGIFVSFKILRDNEKDNFPLSFSVCSGGSSCYIYSALVIKLMSNNGTIKEKLQTEKDIFFEKCGPFMNQFRIARCVDVPLIANIRIDGRQGYVYIPLAYNDFTFMKDLRSDGGVEMLSPNERKTLVKVDVYGIIDSKVYLTMESDPDFQLECSLVEDRLSFYGNRFKLFSDTYRYLGSGRRRFCFRFYLNMPNDARTFGLMFSSKGSLNLRFFSTVSWTFT